MFVEVTSDLTDWDVDFEWLGVPIVAEGAIASGFVYSVLHIKVELEHLIHYQDKHPFQVCTPKSIVTRFSVLDQVY